MRARHSTAVRELRAMARRAVMAEDKLYLFASGLLPGWKPFMVDWWLYEYQRPKGDPSALQRLQARICPKMLESGYGLMRFGIGGYDDAALMLLLKRAEYETEKAPYINAVYRYELALVLSAGGALAFVNCETASVRYGKGFVEELKNLSCEAARAESVTAIESGQPKEMVPGAVITTSDVSAANPGRALELAGQPAAVRGEEVAA